MRRIPALLIGLRLLLGPVLCVMILRDAPRPLVFALFTAAFLSDIFDGVIARRLGVAGELLRRADSIADTVFYLFVAAAALMRHPGIFDRDRVGIVLLAALEITRHIFDRFKYGRSASYHMWSAKLWGIALFTGFGELLLTGTAGILFDCAVALGVATNVEGLIASLILPEWRHDVPSLVHALAIRRRADESATNEGR